MKILGSKRKGKHIGKNTGNGNGNGSVSDSVSSAASSVSDGVSSVASVSSAANEVTGLSGIFNTIAKIWKIKAVKIVSIILGAILVLTGSMYAYYRSAISTPPEQTGRMRPAAQALEADADPDNPSAPGTSPNEILPIEERGSRKEGVYTFLIFGIDDARSDVIMCATFDAKNYTVEVVNIPRDTMVNLNGNMAKINTIVPTKNREFRDEDNAELLAMKAVKEEYINILGYEVDFYVSVDMRAFVALVDSIGGVEFYIPTNMSYVDTYQNLNIQFSQGLKKLNGQQSLEVLRYRRYRAGDIQRISVQQDFLMAATEQILAKIGVRQLPDLITTFVRYVKTDISFNDLLWFGTEFLKMKTENVNFETMPGFYNDSAGGASYVTILVDLWLEMINNNINPFYEEIEYEDLSILTRNSNGRLTMTDGTNPDRQWGGGTNRPPSDFVAPSGPTGTNGGSSSNNNNNNNSNSSDDAEQTGDFTDPENISDTQSEDSPGGSANNTQSGEQSNTSNENEIDGDDPPTAEYPPDSPTDPDIFAPFTPGGQEPEPEPEPPPEQSTDPAPFTPMPDPE